MRKKGSITPFCALSLMLVASLLFTLLESGRVYGLGRYADLKAEMGMDCLCAEFQPLLWQKYGLLFLDGAYGTEEFSENYITENFKNQIRKGSFEKESISERTGLNLFDLQLKEVVLSGYALATDNEGELFLSYVAERVKEDLPLGVAEDLYEQYQLGNQIEQEYGGAEDAIWQAQQTLEQVKESWWKNLLQEEEKEADFSYPVIDTSIIENTWESVAVMQKRSVLELILGENFFVSKKSCQLRDSIREREKQEGTMQISLRSDWYRKLLVMTYLEDYFSNYKDLKEEHFLSYEMEYVLCGQDTDWENLAGAWNRILMVREAANFAYLLQDEEKMMLAESLAGLVGLLAGGNPAVIKTIQLGIIGAWAYWESILDVRALIAGDEIPIVKKEYEWTTDVSNILSSFGASAKAKKCESGLSYVDYLKQLLFFMQNETIAYRMMEVMEESLKSKTEYQNCRMDQMIAAIKYQLQFESEPLFYSLSLLGTPYKEKFCFIKEAERSYIP